MEILLENDVNYIMGKFDKRLLTISSSFYNGGWGKRNGFFIIQVEENFYEDPLKIASNFERIKNIRKYVAFLTAVNLKKNSFVYEDDNFFILITLGLGYICIPAKDCRKSKTINMITVIKKPFRRSAALDLLNVMISTKVYSLMVHGNGVGTSSDSFLLSFNEGKGPKYAGFATEIGKNFSKILLEIMEKGISEWYR